MWWRFLLPALAMTAALIVLFAGVMGDLKSLLSARAIAIIGGKEGVSGRFVQKCTLSQKLSEIRGFRKRSFSNEVVCTRISGRFRLSETCSKTAPKGNWCLECPELAVRSGHRTAKRTILNRSSGDPVFARRDRGSEERRPGKIDCAQGSRQPATCRSGCGMPLHSTAGC